MNVEYPKENPEDFEKFKSLFRKMSIEDVIKEQRLALERGARKTTVFPDPHGFDAATPDPDAGCKVCGDPKEAAIHERRVGTADRRCSTKEGCDDD